MSENTNWQKASLVLFGLLVGGGVSGGIGHWQYSEFTDEVRVERQLVVGHAAKERDKLEAKIEAAQSSSNTVLVELGKLSEKVDNLSAEVNRLRNRVN